MARRKAFAALPKRLLILALLPAAAGAGEGDWFNQRYALSSVVEIDAESMEHPRSRSMALVLPADLLDAEICVLAGGTEPPGHGRTEAVVIITRESAAGESVEIERLSFAWQDDEPAPRLLPCQQVGPPLAAGDLVEFRFRFFDKLPLELHRRGKRIQLLPHLTINAWVETARRPR